MCVNVCTRVRSGGANGTTASHAMHTRHDAHPGYEDDTLLGTTTATPPHWRLGSKKKTKKNMDITEGMYDGTELFDLCASAKPKQEKGSM